MLSVLFAVLAFGASPLPSALPQTPNVATAAPAEAAPRAEPETRRVCRFETMTGSNRRTRVCRDLPRQGVQDQQTREFMRDSQRTRMPDSN
jgi:hypothetical protein